MADKDTVILRLPVSLKRKVDAISSRTGAPINEIFNKAVDAAIDKNGEHHEKEKYTKTCVRLPRESHDAVRNLAILSHASANAIFVQMLEKHIGDEHVVLRRT